jgi:hypothetical protein
VSAGLDGGHFDGEELFEELAVGATSESRVSASSSRSRRTGGWRFGAALAGLRPARAESHVAALSTGPDEKGLDMNKLVRTLVGTAIGALTVGAGTASTPVQAATAGWYTYDVQKTDRCTADLWVWFDANGRPSTTAGVYLDLNNDCRWESVARDVDGNGLFDELWMDHYNPGGGWDALLIGSLLHSTESLEGYGSEGPYNTWWARVGFIEATVGGTAPTSGTAAGAFWNLMTSLAAKTGYAAW